MADTNIALRLTLDALGAKEEASGLVKAVNGFNESMQKFGRQMENTMRGRLIKGVIGTFTSNFSTMMNESLPRIVRESKIQEDLAAAIGGAISPQAGELARGTVRKLQERTLAREELAFQAFSQLNRGGLAPLSQAQAEKVVPLLLGASEHLIQTRTQQAALWSDIRGSAPNINRFPALSDAELRRQVSQEVPAVLEGVFRSSLNFGIGVGGGVLQGAAGALGVGGG